MAGNVREWVNDWYQSDYYDDPAAVDNPQGPTSGEYKVLRGGSWLNVEWLVRAANRDGDFPDAAINFNGFRCARSP